MEHEAEAWMSSQFSQIDLGLKLSRPSPNKSLFRYISLRNKSSWTFLEQSLQERKLFGQTANGLNDPFEINPAVVDDLNDDVIENVLKYKIKEKDVRDLIGLDVDHYRDKANEYISKLRENTRVIAFSDRYDSPLLWAHYANSYRGACLHFLGGRMQAINRFEIGQVSYAEQRPLYPLSLALALAYPSMHSERERIYRWESSKLISFTKAADWSYEREYRIVYDVKRATNFIFQRDSLASIIVGPHMPKDDVNRLVEIILRSDFKNVALRRASVSNSSFAINVDWKTSVTASELLYGRSKL